jgi:hypothetical protein
MRAPVFALCILLSTAAHAYAQRARVELDHIYIAVPRGGLAESQLLRDRGFVVDTGSTRHVGQGTASRGAYFGNAYIELIWVDPDVKLDESGQSSGVDGIARATEWRNNGASPFGIGLHRLKEGDSLNVPVTIYTAAWMQPGTVLEMLTRKEEAKAVELFVVPKYLAVPTWMPQLRAQAPHYLAHTNGSKLITAVEVRGPLTHRPSAMNTLDIVPLRFTEAQDPLVVVELDGGAKGTTIDLRPQLPLLFRQ